MSYLAKSKIDLGWDATNNVYLNYSLQDTLDADLYDDETNVTSWHKVAKFCVVDYIKMREFARQTFVPMWSSLTDLEKTLMIHHFLYPNDMTQQELDTLYPPEDQKLAWQELARDAKACREKRWEEARRRVSYQLPESSSLDLYRTTKSYSLDYKDANDPSLVLWITNGSRPDLGLDFTDSGFAQKSYYTSAARDILVDVLVNGNYSRV